MVLNLLEKMNRKRAEELLEDDDEEDGVTGILIINGTSTEVDYDYGHMKAEYLKELKAAAKSNLTLKYAEVKEEETFKDVLKEMVNFKKPENCSKERGIGDIILIFSQV